MTEPRIAIVIPNYRQADLTIGCLTSLQSAIELVDGDVETVVVDDASGDGSLERVLNAHPWVRSVQRNNNGGYPAAINAGLRETSAPWILTLNNDTTVDTRVLVALVGAAGAAPDVVGCLAAQQRFSQRPDVIYSAGIVLDRIGVNSDRLIGQPIEASERTPTEVFGACGAAAVYSRRMLDDVGLLDESFGFGLEDADLCWRAQMRGWRCLYVPDAIVYHDVGGTVPYGSNRRFEQAGRNRVRLIAKNADSSMLLRYGVWMLAYDLAYVIAVAFRYRTLAPVRGRWQSLREIRAIRRSGAEGRRAVRLAVPSGLRGALNKRANLIGR